MSSGRGNRVPVSASLRSLLDGLLLGDGYYRAIRLSAVLGLTQISRHADWVDKVGQQLKSFGVTTKTSIRKGYVRTTSKGIVINASDAVAGRKLVPRDLDIGSPVVLANWFAGDGNTFIGKGRLESQIATNAFIDEDVLWLATEFDKKLKIHALIKHWRSQPILFMQHRNAAKFLSIVRPLLPPSFSYKAPEDPWETPVCLRCKREIIGKMRSAKWCQSCLPKIVAEQSLSWYYRKKERLT